MTAVCAGPPAPPSGAEGSSSQSQLEAALAPARALGEEGSSSQSQQEAALAPARELGEEGSPSPSRGTGELVRRPLCSGASVAGAGLAGAGIGGLAGAGIGALGSGSRSATILSTSLGRDSEEVVLALVAQVGQTLAQVGRALALAPTLAGAPAVEGWVPASAPAQVAPAWGSKAH